MEPTKTLDTAEFSLHRVIFSSRQRIERSYSSTTNFKCQIDIPRNQDIFRFAIRRVTFPNVSTAWDLNSPPYLYYRVELSDSVGESIYRVPLMTRFTTKVDVAPNSVPQAVATLGSGTLQYLMSILGPNTAEWVSGNVLTKAVYEGRMSKLRILFPTVSATQLNVSLLPSDNANTVTLTLLGSNEDAAGGDQEPAHYANSILGVARTVVMNQTTATVGTSTTITLPFPVNLTGLLHVYLTSTTLSATARSMRPMFTPIENCLLAIPVASSYLTLVDHRPEAPSVWNCNQGNHWDVVDFQLRYDTGGLVDLGGNDVEIEVEFEVMEQHLPATQQMRESIYVPMVNMYDTTRLLLKGNTRSWGSYTGREGNRQFSAGGSTSRVFR